MDRYILSVDQSTSASKAFLVDRKGRIVQKKEIAHRQYYPQAGHVEHDAGEIWRNTLSALQVAGNVPQTAEGLSISNQRETTVLWDRGTGEPVARALVWQDTRAAGLCGGLSRHAAAIRQKTGLALSPYYSAAKAAYVLQHDDALLRRARNGEICIGTIDSYLIYRLSGRRVHATDVTNASRMQLMNLETISWDERVCGWFGIPMDCLPAIMPSDAVFGRTACEGLATGIPITGVLGDSHAALFGHGCMEPGSAKVTYGTGSSVMMNVGESPVLSRSGLSGSVGFGFKGKTYYVLEGNITSAGDTLVWLERELQLIDSPAQAEEYCRQVADTQGVYLVPAFSGLGAPYFSTSAKALICGISRGTTKKHIARAAVESIAYQVYDVVRAVEADSRRELSGLNADGGASRNTLLMQFQADLLGRTLRVPAASERSALGAAYMGGLTIGLYGSLADIPEDKEEICLYSPQMAETRRMELLQGWEHAVAMTGVKGGAK